MPIFEDQTPEVIRDRILSRMDTVLQTREGSYAYDQASPIAFEIWRVLMSLDELVYAFYVTPESGAWLDLHADLLALTRRVGTRATAVMHFEGRDGAVVPAGTQFYTESGLAFELVYDVTIRDGTGTGYLQAVEVGDKYNVDAGEISQIYRNVPGVQSYTNEIAEGGTDPESDESLYERIDFRRKRPATSGNENHYIEWALSCEGVGAVKVQRLWNGPGTVRVIIVGYDHEPVDEAVVAACAAYIETQRPVTAEVTVITAEGTPVDVTARVMLDGKTSLAAAQAEFVSKLDAYLRDVAFDDYTVYYHRIGALLASVDGVVDYRELMLNGVRKNLTITDAAVPVRGKVTLT